MSDSPAKNAPKLAIQKVMIVGGNHGNELTGVYLVRKFQQFPKLIQRSSFDTLTLLANPKAIASRQRFIDTDLNRCFQPQDLANLTLTAYEPILAKQIALEIEEKKIDFIIDLHSTTSQMGLTLILNDLHPFLLKIAAYISQINPLVKVLVYSPAVNEKRQYLRNLTKLGLAIEVGPIAPSALPDTAFFNLTENLIHETLNFIEGANLGQFPPLPHHLTVYQEIARIDYPKDENGEIKALIQGKIQDFIPIEPNKTLFVGLDGQEYGYEGDRVVYPCFCGEVAYQQTTAMVLCTKEQVYLTR